MPHDELADLVAQATAAAEESDQAGRGQRRRREKALAALIPVLVRSARESGVRAVAAGRWLTDVVQEMAPRLPFRDADALRKQHPGMSDPEIAQKLVSNATRTTAAPDEGRGDDGESDNDY